MSTNSTTHSNQHAQSLVIQLRFAKQKWLAGHEGVPEEEATQRLGHANSISWMVGHLACFDQAVWLEMAQNKKLTDATDICAFGQPACTPALDEMMTAWHTINHAVDAYLDTLTDEDLGRVLRRQDGRSYDNIGTVILRQTWHYWYHLGEMQAIRQMLGHTDLPQYVGSLPPEFGY